MQDQKVHVYQRKRSPGVAAAALLHGFGSPVGSVPWRPHPCRRPKPSAPQTSDPGDWVLEVVGLGSKSPGRRDKEGPYAQRWVWVPDRKAQVMYRRQRADQARRKRHQEGPDRVTVDVRRRPGLGQKVAAAAAEVTRKSAPTAVAVAAVVAVTATSC